MDLRSSCDVDLLAVDLNIKETNVRKSAAGGHLSTTNVEKALLEVTIDEILLKSCRKATFIRGEAPHQLKLQ